MAELSYKDQQDLKNIEKIRVVLAVYNQRIGKMQCTE